jgi:NADP-dependent 3-hydroxy acid dehydrogenase YdfG
MTNNVWFITGAGRGMGLDIAKAALAAGHKVVATGDYEEIMNKASCLSLLSNAVLVWNTIKIGKSLGNCAQRASKLMMLIYRGYPPWLTATGYPIARTF